MFKTKRRKRQPFISGFCAYGPHSERCKGQFQNGALVRPLWTLCSCDCHGDYDERLIAAGQGPQLEYVEETEDEDELA